MIAGALRADPAKFESKSTQSVRSRVGNIRSFLKKDMDLPAFWQYLKDAFGGEGLETGTLTAEELAAVQALKERKYDTWEWTYGRSPRFTFTISASGQAAFWRLVFRRKMATLWISASMGISSL